jgi:hypothetical protein
MGVLVAGLEVLLQQPRGHLLADRVPVASLLRLVQVDTAEVDLPEAEPEAEAEHLQPAPTRPRSVRAMILLATSLDFVYS